MPLALARAKTVTCVLLVEYKQCVGAGGGRGLGGGGGGGGGGTLYVFAVYVRIGRLLRCTWYVYTEVGILR